MSAIDPLTDPQFDSYPTKLQRNSLALAIRQQRQVIRLARAAYRDQQKRFDAIIADITALSARLRASPIPNIGYRQRFLDADKQLLEISQRQQAQEVRVEIAANALQELHLIAHRFH